MHPTRKKLLRRLATTAVALAALSAAPASARLGTVVARPSCAPAAIADVVLPSAVEVDEIRVILSPSSPMAGASQVIVDAGDSDRIVRVRGQSKALSFAPAMFSAQYRVSLEPVLSAKRDACVERVELLRRGRTVATMAP